MESKGELENSYGRGIMIQDLIQSDTGKQCQQTGVRLFSPLTAFLHGFVVPTIVAVQSLVSGEKRSHRASPEF